MKDSDMKQFCDNMAEAMFLQTGMVVEIKDGKLNTRTIKYKDMYKNPIYDTEDKIK